MRPLIFVCTTSVLSMSVVAGAAGQCEPHWDYAPGLAGYGKAGPAGNVWTARVLDDGSGPALYVAGEFMKIIGPGLDAEVAKWDGHEWTRVGSNDLLRCEIIDVDLICTAVRDIAVFDGGSGPRLYVTGDFPMSSEHALYRIAVLVDNGQWADVGGGLSDSARALAVYDHGSGPSLIVAGHFTKAGNVQASRIARWDGSAWHALGAGLSSWVQAMRVWDDGSGPSLFVTGNFGTAGGVPASRIARWDGENWFPLGDGLLAAGQDFAVFDDGTGESLYVANAFVVGKPTPSRVARWDGAEWHAVDDGQTDGGVAAMIPFDDGTGLALYAGGFFEMAGGVPAVSIARWNGVTWAPVGDGIPYNTVWPGSVYTLAAIAPPLGNALVAGGAFDQAGDVELWHLAAWTGCPPCYADLDNSGDLTLFDFFAFVNLFNAADPKADCDESGGLTLFDFFCFVNAFNGGC